MHEMTGFNLQLCYNLMKDYNPETIEKWLISLRHIRQIRKKHYKKNKTLSILIFIKQ